MRLFGTHNQGIKSQFIFAQRTNNGANFRKMKPARNVMIGGQAMTFDYDSVDSCSSDELTDYRFESTDESCSDEAYSDEEYDF
jgi:hypothetical protein